MQNISLLLWKFDILSIINRYVKLITKRRIRRNQVLISEIAINLSYKIANILINEIIDNVNSLKNRIDKLIDYWTCQVVDNKIDQKLTIIDNIFDRRKNNKIWWKKAWFEFDTTWNDRKKFKRYFVDKIRFWRNDICSQRRYLRINI